MPGADDGRACATLECSTFLAPPACATLECSTSLAPPACVRQVFTCPIRGPVCWMVPGSCGDCRARAPPAQLPPQLPSCGPTGANSMLLWALSLPCPSPTWFDCTPWFSSSEPSRGASSPASAHARCMVLTWTCARCTPCRLQL
eukprot:244132-Chlamydomonas_euryale.AAC.27